MAPDTFIKSRKKSVFGGFIGTSQIMQNLYHRLESAAKSDAPVFITGESGAGKELCAQALHKYSQRRDHAFVPLNCAAIPKDLMEAELFGHVKGAFTGAVQNREGAVKIANGGTLFLDEIGDMALDMQSKLLRFLQNHKYRKVGGDELEKANIRIVCATNLDPFEEIKKKRFREDLFYRLYVIPLHMPPLHMRGEDVIDIAHALLHDYANQESKDFQHFSKDVEDYIKAYHWPGNIRELQNIIRNIVVMNEGEIVTSRMFPGHIVNALTSPQKTDCREDFGASQEASQKSASYISSDELAYAAGLAPELENQSGMSFMEAASTTQHVAPLWLVEKRAIERAIAYCGGNIPKAAIFLDISPSTIYRKKAIWKKSEKENKGTIC